MTRLEEIGERLLEGKAPCDIALEFGVSLQYIHKCKWKLGLTNPIEPTPIEPLIASYQELQSTYAVAEKHNMSQPAVYRRLKAAGVDLPERGRARKPRGEESHTYKDGKGKDRSIERRKYQVHLQVAALCLGFPLPKGWVVHHHDEDPTNNHWTNLWVFPDAHSHGVYHQRLLALRRVNPEVDANQLALENGGLRLPPPRDPDLFELYIDPSVPLETIWSRLGDR